MLEHPNRKAVPFHSDETEHPDMLEHVMKRSLFTALSLTSAMDAGVTLGAERDQILLGVVSGLTAKSLVVDFKVG
jgi:hypothetical protein